MTAKTGTNWKDAVAQGGNGKSEPEFAGSWCTGRLFSGGFALPAAAPHMMLGRGVSAAVSSRSSVSESSFRDENNLDQLMLNAAKTKAAKSLKVDY